jgi:hypothetical protein
MSYSFEIIGVSSLWNFFQHQQQVEQTPNRSCAYLGSHVCTLDSFIEATDLVHQKPDWDWDAVVNQMVNFWLTRGSHIRHWKAQLDNAEGDNLIVARVANFQSLRCELESIFRH